MKFNSLKSVLLCSLTLSIFAMATTAHANAPAQTSAEVNSGSNAMDEIDPFDPAVNQLLEQMDQDYEGQTGMPSHIEDELSATLDLFYARGCYRQACAVWALVDKSSQTLTLHVNGNVVGRYATSTGVAGRSTPNFDRHPDGRIYQRYTSTKFPGGDYNGMGNMPYAVFISGGFAIHGTGQGNWRRLGQPASHGCIRIHPDNAQYFNSLVRSYGIRNTWITVQ